MFPTTRKRFTAFVVFVGSDTRNFWRLFTRRGWRHCWLIIPAYYPAPGLNAEQFSIIIDAVGSHVNVDLSFDPPARIADRLLSEGATCVIRFPVDRIERGDYVPRGLLTCVSLIKSVLEIRDWKIWTPEQLARKLLREGGKFHEVETDVQPFQRRETQARPASREGAAPAGASYPGTDG